MSDIYQLIKSRQIRRLLLHAGEFDDPLCGAFDVVSLDKNPRYEALSYVWGNECALSAFVLGNVDVEITQNLDCALRHLRHRYEERILWVDAICINQGSINEKNEQVGLMQDIYQLAVTVLVWLGPSTNDSDLAMKKIEEWDHGYWQTYEFCRLFLDLICRPWFNRLWVLQEFVLNPNHPLIGCGFQWVNWLNFIHAWSKFKDNSLDLFRKEMDLRLLGSLIKTFETNWKPSMPREAYELEVVHTDLYLKSLRECFGVDFTHVLGYPTVSELIADIRRNPVVWKGRGAVIRYCRYESPTAKTYWRRAGLDLRVPLTYVTFLYNTRRSIIKGHQYLPLTTIFKGSRNLRSADARDRVYGILGLATKEARQSIPIDYSKPWWWSFPYAMAYIISHEAGGLALTDLFWKSRPFKTEWPSWVPNFTTVFEYNNAHTTVNLRGSCFNEFSSWTHGLQVSQDLTVLSAPGFNLGRVMDLIRFFDGDPESTVARLQQIETLVKEKCPRNESLWRTLIGARNTMPESLQSGLPFDKRWEILLGRTVEGIEVNAAFAHTKELLEYIRDVTLKRRAFFVTDQGFAGISTPEIKEADTIALLLGSGRPAVLRETDPRAVGVKTEMDDKGLQFHRVTAFAYVGCHDREDYEESRKQNKEGWHDLRHHSCYQDRKSNGHISHYHII